MLRWFKYNCRVRHFKLQVIKEIKIYQEKKQLY